MHDERRAVSPPTAMTFPPVASCSGRVTRNKPFANGGRSTGPLRTLKADRVKRRTRVLSKDELAEMLAAIKDRQLREFMQAMTFCTQRGKRLTHSL